MKKLIAVFLTAMLLCACGEKTPEYSEPEESISDIEKIDYSSLAHEQLENDRLPTDIPSDIPDESEYVSTVESAPDVSEESIEDVYQDDSADVSTVIDESETDAPIVKERVLVVTADIAYADGTSASLVCTAEGSVDLYFGNGVAFTDMEAHADVSQHGETLLSLGATYYDRGNAVTDFPFPESGTTYIYIKTENAVYRIQYNNTVTQEGYLYELERAISSSVLAITLKAEQ